MKTLLLGLIAALLLFVTASAQSPHLYIRGMVAVSEHKQREMIDLGTTLHKHTRLSVYVEDFKTQPAPYNKRYGVRTGGYRKFFLGARYSYVYRIKKIVDVVPSIGLDIRLNGGNTHKTWSKGIYGTVANMPSLRTGIALERSLSYEPFNPLCHIKLTVNAYTQDNFRDNFGKKIRPGIGAGVIIIF